ncbi:hypothetical protein N7454_009519 [Penicillium verhagenii]|nr:hypothetical protein N7454_009519 [Penicillium verhagenii]
MSPSTTTVPVALSAEAIEDLIYDARAGDLEALNSDIATLSSQHSCPEWQIVASAIDTEEESEGGTGACVLHFPAANGNSEILNALLQKLAGADAAQRISFLNHRNHSGNTALHWAALNTHLECVKALVEAGSDVTIKNDAGHDAVFLAERAAWSASAEEVKEDGEGNQEIEMTIGESEEGADNAGEMSAGRQVVEWLLSSEKAAALESGATEGESSA